MRLVGVLAIALNAFIFAVDVALGSVMMFLPPVLIVILLALIVAQTRMIGTLRRTREPNQQAAGVTARGLVVRIW